jgi:hypothetical protein
MLENIMAVSSKPGLLREGSRLSSVLDDIDKQDQHKKSTFSRGIFFTSFQHL